MRQELFELRHRLQVETLVIHPVAEHSTERLLSILVHAQVAVRFHELLTGLIHRLLPHPLRLSNLLLQGIDLTLDPDLDLLSLDVRHRLIGLLHRSSGSLRELRRSLSDSDLISAALEKGILCHLLEPANLTLQEGGKVCVPRVDLRKQLVNLSDTRIE